MGHLTLEFKPPRNIHSKPQQSLWRGKFKSERNVMVCLGVLLCQTQILPVIHWSGAGCSKRMHRWEFSEDRVLVLRLDMHPSRSLAESNTEKSLRTALKHYVEDSFISMYLSQNLVILFVFGQSKVKKFLWRNQLSSEKEAFHSSRGFITPVVWIHCFSA